MLDSMPPKGKKKALLKLSDKRKSLLLDWIIKESCDEEMAEHLYEYCHDRLWFHTADVSMEESTDVSELNCTFIAADDEEFRRNLSHSENASKKNAMRSAPTTTPILNRIITNGSNSSHSNHSSRRPNDSKKKRKGLLNKDSVLKDSFDGDANDAEDFELAESPGLASPPPVGRRESLKIDQTLAQHMYYSSSMDTTSDAPPKSSSAPIPDRKSPPTTHKSAVISLDSSDEEEHDTRRRTNSEDASTILSSTALNGNSSFDAVQPSPSPLAPHLQFRQRFLQAGNTPPPNMRRSLTTDTSSASNGSSTSSNNTYTPILPVTVTRKRKSKSLFNFLPTKKARTLTLVEDNEIQVMPPTSTPAKESSPIKAHSSSRHSPAADSENSSKSNNLPTVSLASKLNRGVRKLSNVIRDSDEEEETPKAAPSSPPSSDKSIWSAAKMKENDFNSEKFQHFDPAKLQLNDCKKALEKLQKADVEKLKIRTYYHLRDTWMPYLNARLHEAAMELATSELSKDYNRKAQFHNDKRLFDKIVELVKISEDIQRKFAQQNPPHEDLKRITKLRKLAEEYRQTVSNTSAELDMEQTDEENLARYLVKHRDVSQGRAAWLAMLGAMTIKEGMQIAVMSAGMQK